MRTDHHLGACRLLAQLQEMTTQSGGNPPTRALEKGLPSHFTLCSSNAAPRAGRQQGYKTICGQLKVGERWFEPRV